jgi:hypothetical protein
MKQANVLASHPLPISLYRRLIGTAWPDVDEAVRQSHLDGGLLRRVGSFRVQCGTSNLARLLLAILRAPSAAEAVATELVITPLACGEKWVRRFGDKTLITTQAGRSGGVLIERISMVELRFRLDVSDGSLIYRQIGTALRLGPLSVPLPEWLSPRVEVREEAEGLKCTHVSVVVTAPFAGLLISYDGQIHEEEPG